MTYIRTVNDLRNDSIMYESFSHKDVYEVWGKRLGVCVMGMIVCGQIYLGFQYFYKPHPVAGSEYATEQRSVR